ncbi:GTP-binding protein [Paraburkholderia unamae]|uniref:GTP-binding protein n=1 Tax=Paraburkholderia unamae TaxID=219649 RepID=A0ACC6RSD2_9BURK
MMAASARIPATVVTGFLGAGKSTLLRRILTERHGRRIAVVENEFAEENIDSDILVESGAEQIIQMSNGCVCCSIRDDLRATLGDLARRRAQGEIAFDQVLIETTGLADPGPIAQTFFLDPEIAAQYRPDAILTLVDARFGPGQLTERQEARRQVGFADRLFLTKGDLVSAESLDALADNLRHLNPSAPQSRVHFGDVDLRQVFDVGGFNLSADLDPLPDGIDEHHHVGIERGHHAHHCSDVNSLVFRSERPLNPRRFGQFLNAVITSHGPRLLRYKGVLNLAGQEQKVILQGVHELVSYDAGTTWGSAEPRLSKLVFIGLGLPREIFLKALADCVM